ncbi:sigma-70 family RNA polymerase sigma factor [Streptosporangiaceae bacterium NEAU-GS5]|nr:sigma-70 family RNA polymerase sigma factor [Streptosporangiaceae bacterium NEAU-GS5]
MDDFLAERFEGHRRHLKAVAYRMLGSLTEADDAVQEAWLRLSRTDPATVDNLGGWLTTVVGRVCLDMLRSRSSRREEPLGAWTDERPETRLETKLGTRLGGRVGGRLPDPVVARDGGADPEQQALVADAVGLALLVVLESLGPAERLAFVLHDMFAVPFEDIAPIVGRSPEATRKLASRARGRVRGAAPVPDPDLARQRAVVAAFLAAARGGDFEALLAVLDPDVELRADIGALRVVRGAAAVAGQAIFFRRMAFEARPALVNGAAGLVNTIHGTPVSVMAFTIVDGRIAGLDILADPDRLEALDLRIP